MATHVLNPFDLNLSRAYSAPSAFCPRPDLEEILERACAGRLWTLIGGDRRMGKSSAVIADSVRCGRPILHVDLMGVGSEPEVTERFRWAWQFFVQHAASGFWKGVVPVCAEIWVQDAQGRPIAPADVEVGWRNVVANAAQYFLPRISSLSGLQSRMLRYVARNPRVQPFSEVTLSAVKSESGPVHRALRKLLALELLREEEHGGRKRVWVHDARLGFYLRA